MATKTIPAKFICICDACSTEHESEREIDRPEGWVLLKAETGALNHHDREVADGSKRVLMCRPCYAELAKVMELWFQKRNPRIHPVLVSI